jgi:hypothetical protein
VTARRLEAPALLAAAAAMTAAALAAPVEARAFLVLPLALLTPGWAIVAVAFGPRRPSVPVRIALSVLLSMSVFALLAVLLAELSQGVTRDNVLVAVNGLVATLALALALGMRRTRVDMPAQASGERRHALATWAVAAGALALAGGVVGLSLAWLPEAQEAGYRQLRLAGEWAGVDRVVQARRDRPVAIDFEVANRTRRSERYRISAQVDGGPRWPAASPVLRAGASTRGVARAWVPPDGCLHRVRLRLTASGARLRPLTLWVRGAAPGGRPRCRS